MLDVLKNTSNNILLAQLTYATPVIFEDEFYKKTVQSINVTYILIFILNVTITLSPAEMVGSMDGHLLLRFIQPTLHHFCG